MSLQQTDPSLFSYLESCQEELRELLFSLCAIPAPSGSEQARAEFCRAWLSDNGAQNVEIDRVNNVLLPLGCEDGKPVLVVMAHTDTVFPDLTPFQVTVKGDRALCPAIGDDTANVAVLLILARWFLRQGAPENVGLLFVCNTGEEGLGNLKDVREIVNTYGPRIRQLISLDGDCDSVCTRAVGSGRYQVTVRTQGGHSFRDFGQKNAIAELSTLITRLYAAPLPEKDGACTTFNVGMISGGTSVNAIAQQAEMLWEYRSDSDACLETMKAPFFATLEAARSPQVHIDCKLLGERPGMGPVDPGQEEALAALCADALEAQFGHRPTYASGSTDCNIPLSLGIPAVSFGCCRTGGAHTREEWLELSSLLPGAQAAARVIATLISET